MTYRNSSHTGRFPRTMEEAFGPYTNPEFEEQPPTDYEDIFVLVSGIVALTVCFTIMYVFG